jgi:hypothetical protein
MLEGCQYKKILKRSIFAWLTNICSLSSLNAHAELMQNIRYIGILGDLRRKGDMSSTRPLHSKTSLLMIDSGGQLIVSGLWWYCLLEPVETSIWHSNWNLSLFFGCNPAKYTTLYTELIVWTILHWIDVSRAVKETVATSMSLSGIVEKSKHKSRARCRLKCSSTTPIFISYKHEPWYCQEIFSRIPNNCEHSRK